MRTCECPGCHVNLSLEGCEETEVVKCPKCGMLLEVVSLAPPILEESLADEVLGDSSENW